QAARPAVVEERVVAEEPLVRPTTPPPAEDLTYAQRLEGDKPDEASLDKGRPAAAAAKTAKPVPTPKPVATPSPKLATSTAPATTAPRPAPTATPEARVADAGVPPATSLTPKPDAATLKPTVKPPSPKATASPAAKSSLPSFTIQVGAFKDKATADSVVTRLKSKGFAAYLVAPESDGSALFNVRVGSYPARADAERVQTKLRDQEKFKPFIVKN
ncbi:MAG TPA: SPOR domain-containing protein, partial [Vicinamibacteria bacterium]|nr:SPOR domain-containing protein [Vicinamibacteria bacterium]